MKRIQILVIFLFAVIVSYGQQLPASSFFDMHGVLHNPATAGSQKHGVLGGLFRTQWSGMPGAPQTGLLFGNTYLNKSKIGLGALLFNDVTGPLSRNGLQAGFSFQIPVI